MLINKKDNFFFIFTEKNGHVGHNQQSYTTYQVWLVFNEWRLANR